MNPTPLKIFVNDNAMFKFSMMLITHWRERGHEVFFEPGANPSRCEWADLIYIDFMDGNFYSYFNGVVGDHQAVGWEPYPKKRIAVRGIDIDIWQQRHNDPKIWSYLDDFIVINQFYYDKVHNETTPNSDGKLHLIRPGVDLTTFTFKPDRQRGYNIGCVTGNLWEAKASFETIRIYQELYHKYPDQPWELYIRGQYFPPEWRTYAHEQLIKNSPFPERIHIVPQISIPEMVEFYKRMDYILIPSHKEAFSFAAAEGMATGAKPVLNNWFGSEWPDKYRFNSIHEAVEMIAGGEWNPSEYRQYIEEHYDAERMFKEYDLLFGT